MITNRKARNRLRAFIMKQRNKIMSDITVSMSLSPKQTGKLYMENEANKEQISQLQTEIEHLKGERDKTKTDGAQEQTILIIEFMRNFQCDADTIEQEFLNGA